MPENLSTVAYIIAGALFILSLGGLSAQQSARRGNVFGIVGMLIAVAVTASTHLGNLPLLVGAVGVGGLAGAVLALRVEMTSMPELVAILHSFVGLAAVLVGFGTYLSPDAPRVGAEGVVHELEVFLGVFVGALTF
ncbi:MAG: NAD(P)(+) transhydrogenase (Re/Si-specific) subunit beta, partial [Polyangiaceae bacterium]|nr:NAD(P)(+) transhydrogenase (Re/Si-specific) subunit beta [Polyangiaceae bacterium]